MLYSNSKDTFSLLDYSPSHSQLLLRSKKQKNRDYNIDIIFKGVRLLLIPSSLNGIDISVVGEVQGTLPEYDLLKNQDYEVLILQDSDGKKYYINAMCFGVYQNKLDILETSINRYDFEDFGEKVFWYSGD